MPSRDLPDPPCQPHISGARERSGGAVEFQSKDGYFRRLVAIMDSTNTAIATQPHGWTSSGRRAAGSGTLAGHQKGPSRPYSARASDYRE